MIHKPGDLHGAHVPFYPCASLYPLFAAAPWGISKEFIISQARACLAHTVSPTSPGESCSLTVLGRGDTLIQVVVGKGCRWNWKGHEEMDETWNLTKKAAGWVLVSLVLAFSVGSQLRC